MFIDVNLGDTHEPKPVAPGRYMLVVTEAKYNPPKEAGKAPNIQVSFGIREHEDAPNVTQWFSLPKADDEANVQNFKKLQLKRFLTQFKVPTGEGGGFDVMDLTGAEAEAELGLSDPSESKDGKTVYNRLVLDKLGE